MSISAGRSQLYAASLGDVEHRMVRAIENTPRESVGEVNCGYSIDMTHTYTPQYECVNNAGGVGAILMSCIIHGIFNAQHCVVHCKFKAATWNGLCHVSSWCGVSAGMCICTHEIKHSSRWSSILTCTDVQVSLRRCKNGMNKPNPLIFFLPHWAALNLPHSRWGRRARTLPRCQIKRQSQFAFFRHSHLL